MKAIYQKEPPSLDYMLLPDGRADVWLRTDIMETADEEGNPCWECEEISFRTKLTKEAIEESFDAILANGGVTYDEDAEEETIDGITLKDRMEAAEEAILELLLR